MNLRFKSNPGLASDEERPYPFWAIGLVRGHAHQIYGQRRQVDLDLARRLRCIDVKYDAPLAANVTDRRDVLYYPYFVINQHHGCKNGVRFQGIIKLVEIEQTVVPDIQIRHFESLTTVCSISTDLMMP